MIPVFDGHNDTLLKHAESPERDFFAHHDDGHLDYVRAREAGFAGGFFAVFAPSPEAPELDRLVRRPDGTTESAPTGALDPADAARHVHRMVAQFLRWARDPEGRFQHVTTAADLERAIDEGRMAGILHFEGAEAIGPDLAALDVYHAVGLRSLGPVWSRPNLFGHGVPFVFPATPDLGPGLTAHGRALVRRCNELGIMLDLSHITERGFWDVAGLSTAPLVATHSNAHAVCPHPRNLTDAQLDAVRQSDGMVGLNFAVRFLAPDGSGETGLPLETMVRHVDHLVDKLGIERVGFGSDFDGAGIPDAIGDVRGVQRLLDALADAGYDEVSLRKLAYQNWVRVLRATWGA